MTWLLPRPRPRASESRAEHAANRVGVESFDLALELDASSGRILGGHSLVNRAEFRLWIPFSGDVAPPRTGWPTTPGRDVPFDRRLRLEPLAASAD